MKIKSEIFLFVMGMTLLFFMQSCGNNAYYDQVYSFKNQTWKKGDTAVFEVEVEDTIIVHDFILSLRTTKEYMFNNLWVYIMVTAPDGSTSKVAQEIPLARPDGAWIGRVSGTLVESRLRFDAKSFPIKGEYEFKVVNATQEEQIDEVLNIGLRIE